MGLYSSFILVLRTACGTECTGQIKDFYVIKPRRSACGGSKHAVNISYLALSASWRSLGQTQRSFEALPRSTMLKTLQSGEQVHPSTGSGLSLIACCGLEVKKLLLQEELQQARCQFTRYRVPGMWYIKCKRM